MTGKLPETMGSGFKNVPIDPRKDYNRGGGPRIPLNDLLEKLKVKKNKTKADKTKIAQLKKLKKKKV